MMTMRPPRCRVVLATAATVLWSSAVPSAQAPKRPAAPAGPGASGAPAFFTTPLSLDEMKGKQAVVTTGLGDIVLALLPESAPNHVGYFMKLAREGHFISGLDLAESSLAKKADYDIIHGTDCYVDGGLVGQGIDGKVIMFSTPEGICVGSNGGNFANVTQKKYRVGEYVAGSAAYKDGFYRVVLNN